MFFLTFSISNQLVIIERRLHSESGERLNTFLSDQDPAVHGGPGPDHQRVEGRGGEQRGRPVPRGHLLLPQIRPN